MEDEARHNAIFAQSSPKGATETFASGIGGRMVGGPCEALVTESQGKDRNPGPESALEESASKRKKLFPGCRCSFGKENDGLPSLKASADLPEDGVEGGELVS